MKQHLTFKTLIISGFAFLMLVSPGIIQGKSEQGKAASAKESSSNQDVVVGNVNRVQGNVVEVDDKKSNKKVQASIDQQTKIVGQDKKTLKLSEIKKQDTVAVVSDATGSPAVKKVTKLFVKQASASAQQKRQAVQGIITNISGSTITIAHQIKRDRVYQILTTSTTQIKSPKEATSSATLQVGQRIVAMGDNVGNNTISARLIHIIPGKATGITRKYPISTQSSTISATPTVMEASPTSTLQP